MNGTIVKLQVEVGGDKDMYWTCHGMTSGKTKRTRERESCPSVEVSVLAVTGVEERTNALQ